MNNPLQHVAIIPDGNGRYAKKSQQSRLWGHEQGAARAAEIIRYAASQEIPYLTLFLIGKDNFKRPTSEVTNLLRLMVQYVQSEQQQLMALDIKVQVLGDLTSLPQWLTEVLQQVVERTAQHQGLTLTLVINYSTVWYLSNIFGDILAQHKPLHTEEMVDQERLQQRILGPVPAIDLLIRTSGEQRLSDFLPLHCQYAEFYFTEVLWPEFSTSCFDQALLEFQRRDRRFGAS